MRLLLSALIVFLTVGSAAAQSVTFTSDVGIMTFTVRSDRTAAFEDVVSRLAATLRDGSGGVRQGVTGLKFLKISGQSSALYVLLADPVIPGADYSMEHLLRTVLLPPEAENLISLFKFATDGSAPTVTNFSMLADLNSSGATPPPFAP